MVLYIQIHSTMSISHITHLIFKPWLRVVLLKQAPTPFITAPHCPVTVQTVTPEITLGGVSLSKHALYIKVSQAEGQPFKYLKEKWGTATHDFK